MDEEELWTDLFGLEDYYSISSWGRVWKKPRQVVLKTGIVRNYQGAFCEFNSIDMEGYYVLYYRIDGKRGKIRLHRAVALSFHGEPPEGKPLVRHLDGDKTHNRLKNLVWGSHVENGKDRVEHGGNRNNTCETLKRVFGAMVDHGVPTTQIGNKLGITSHTVRVYLKKHRNMELVE